MNRPSILSTPGSPGRRRTRRRRQIIIGLLIYSIVGFFIVPAIVKSQLNRRLPILTHRPATVRQVRANPYALSLTIRGLSLVETNGEPFAGFDELYVNFQLSSLFRLAWTFSEIRLVHPTANISRGADGQFNFADLVSHGPAPTNAPMEKPGALPAILVQHLVITNGNFHFADLTHATPFRIDYGPVNLDLKEFTTQRKKNGLYSLDLTTPSGGQFSWVGTVSANPPQSAGKFTLRGGALNKYSSYLGDFVRAEIASGLLDISTEYRFDAENSPIQLDTTNTAVKLTNFQLETPGAGEMLLALDNVEVTGGSASLTGHEARVRRVAVSGGSLLTRRESDGQLNWLKLLVQGTNSTAASTVPQTNSLSWKTALDEFNLENFSVTIEDRIPPTPAQLGLDELRVNVQGVSNQSNAPVNAMVEFKWRGGGTVHMDAGGTLLPLAGEAKLSVSQLALPPIQPYMEKQARVILNSGNLTINGRAHYAPAGGLSALLDFTGDVSIGKFASIDTIAYHDLLKWDDFNLRGIKLTLQTNALSIDEIKFAGLETSLVVSSNGQLAVRALLKEPSPAIDAAPETATIPSTGPTAGASGAFPIKVAAVTFEKCSFRAADQSLEPHFSNSIEEFSGTIHDLTWPGMSRADVNIRGKVSELAPFEISGSLLPDIKNPFVDLRLTLKNNDLTAFTPYTEKFVGHPLNKGKLSFDMNYRIENRKLDATNNITLDQFTFGPRNGSTNATKLPVKLAVALLKDRNGRIDLNLPVTGSLDDPQFSIASLVWKTIENILLKVAASPFSLLGAMFGGGEELQYVDFAPGSVTLDPAQTNKLNTLAKALYARPALNVEINASIDSADRERVSRQKLRDEMKSRRLEELTARGKPTPTLNEFRLDPDDYERLLRQRYQEAFKMSPERALREARETAAASNAPPASSGTHPVDAKPADLKGATRLMQEISSASAAGAATTPATSPGNKTQTTKPKTEAEIVLDEMEHRLAAASPASEDDLRDFMQQRSLTVQKFLIDTGEVTADRIYLVTPKPGEAAVKGLPRVTFSLD